MNAAQNLDFQAINSAVLANPSFLERRLPNAKRQGRELKAGDIHGAPGDSFSINIESGKWADFATDESGGDTVSFVAAQEGIGQGEAARLISDALGLPITAPLVRKSKKLPYCPIDWDNPSHVYPYYNPDGSHAYDVLRWEKEGYRKSIRQSKGFDENGNRIQSRLDAKQVPYNLCAAIGTPSVSDSSFVVIVEGENKANSLLDMDICASCNPGGAGKWMPEYAQYFKGKGIVILPDNDDPGKKHAAAVAESLAPVAEYVKIVDLPGLPEKGDVLDWLQMPGNDKERLQALMNDAPYWKPEPGKEPDPRPLSIDWTACGGVSYLTAYPEQFQYLLRWAFLQGELGLISGPPGSGKGTFSLQMAAYMAAGLPVFDWWEVPEPVKVLYISAEDSRPVIHRRLHHALIKLPEEMRYDAAARIVAIPVRGRVNICQCEGKAGVSLTAHLDDLRKIISEFRPGLVFLDTLSRFLGVDENDNPAMTAACGVIEEIMKEYGCNVIMLHHVNKAAGDCVNKEDELAKALNQTAIRGASALAGAVRFAVVFAPLGKDLAGKLLGEEAKDKAAGSYLAIRAAKKNIGVPEPRLYFGRGENGLLYRMEEVNTAGTIEEDARKLAEEVKRRAETGEKALSASKGGREAFGWGDTQNKKATAKAIQLGLLAEVDKEKGKGKVLSPKAGEDSQDFGMFNYE
ncbi:MAG: AAA family ATPase [Desulfovibrio sp.]|jgi:RecA-family ATPase|nr:AAA family ATPase [Desulfovibrio sp.]